MERTARDCVGPVLVFGFGTTVAMWTVGYVCHLPLVRAPSELSAVLLVLTLPLGGFLAARATGRLAVAWQAGLLSSVLNLLVLGSVISSSVTTNRIEPSKAIWIPGFLLAGAVLGALGGLFGKGRAPAEPPERSWTGALAPVASVATLLLVVAGGLVTGERAGMAVYDWPTTEEYNMFLYPVTRMTGGIFYEHTHRLLGTLVGLAAIVLAVFVHRRDERRAVRRLTLTVVLAVVVQGVLGGLRVTEDNLPLAVAHAAFGQLIFAAVVGIAAVCSTLWLSSAKPKAHAGAHTDRKLGYLLLWVALGQVVLGALVRQLDWGLHLHITGAAVVLLLGFVVGLRIWGLHGDVPPLRQAGAAVLLLILGQVVLGFAALIAAGATSDYQEAPPVDTLITTAHQAVGALILATAVLLAAWSTRLLTPPE